MRPVDTRLQAQNVLAAQRESLLKILQRRYCHIPRTYQIAATALRQRAGPNSSALISNPRYSVPLSRVVGKKRKPSVSIGDTMIRNKAAEEGMRYVEWELQCQAIAAAGRKRELELSDG